MKKLLNITRRRFADDDPYVQTFLYESDDENATVATALREINKRPQLCDVDGNPADPISWESSCLQKKCGACAMLVNGIPRVACDAQLASEPNETVTLEPLSKFPVVRDLMVDRDALFVRLNELRVWFESEVDLPVKRGSAAYEGSRCLQCGCCLEACPNFSADGPFGGMASMVPLSRLLAEAGVDQRKRIAKTYREAVFAGCGKSLACRNICPAEIPIDDLMARSNAAAVWGRF